MAGPVKKVTFDDVMASINELAELQKEASHMIKELKESQKETNLQMKETDRRIKESQEKTDLQMKETDRKIKEAQEETNLQMKETDRRIKESQEKTDFQMKETDRKIKEAQEETGLQIKEVSFQMKETDRRMRETDRRFNSQWGKLIEGLVGGRIAQKFFDRGIKVTKTIGRAEAFFENKEYEFDLVLCNGDEIVIIEVKTTLDVDKVDHFIEKMKNFKRVFPEYKDKKVYGAVAYIVADSHSDRYAEKKKLYIIKATGDSSAILNEIGFNPRTF